MPHFNPDKPHCSKCQSIPTEEKPIVASVIIIEKDIPPRYKDLCAAHFDILLKWFGNYNFQKYLPRDIEHEQSKLI